MNGCVVVDIDGLMKLIWIANEVCAGIVWNPVIIIYPVQLIL